MNENIIMLFKSPAKKGFHHRVNLLGHVLDQQWNSRADTPVRDRSGKNTRKQPFHNLKTALLVEPDGVQGFPVSALDPLDPL